MFQMINMMVELNDGKCNAELLYTQNLWEMQKKEVTEGAMVFLEEHILQRPEKRLQLSY